MGNAHWIGSSGLTLSALQTKTDTFANSVDPDEMAHNEPSQQDLHCLPFWLASPYETVDMSKFKAGRVHLRNLGVKGLMDDVVFKTFQIFICNLLIFLHCAFLKGSGYTWEVFYHFVQRKLLFWLPVCVPAHKSPSDKGSKFFQLWKLLPPPLKVHPFPLKQETLFSAIRSFLKHINHVYLLYTQQKKFCNWGFYSISPNQIMVQKYFYTTWKFHSIIIINWNQN